MFDIIWISISFLSGLLVVLGKLPPMIGYIGAGFILHFIGVEKFSGLSELSELGISLLLFSIGLKLDLKSLGKPEILGVTIAQTIISFCVIFLVNYFLIGPEFIVSSSIIAFALTFSSTIFAVKILEQRGDFTTNYGRMSIGVLIIQDIFAVLFMAFSTQKTPSAWLLLLITSLWPLRIILSGILTRIRQSELMVLFGLTVSFGGAYLFDQVNVKGDIGALILGILLSKHHRALELNRWLISFKDFFLLGFFLSVGMIGLPTIEQIGIAILINLFLPLRMFIYFFSFSRFGLRSRTSFLTSASLTNFSEFGLIVCSFAVGKGLLDSSWLTTLAITISFSFITSAFFNHYAEKLSQRYTEFLGSFQRKDLHNKEKDVDLQKANVLIIGMGRVGQGAYKYFLDDNKRSPLAIEVDDQVLSALNEKEINAIYGNATSPDFWQRVQLKNTSVSLILLAMPLVRQNCVAAQLIRKQGFKGTISSIAKFPDDEPVLLDHEIDSVFNLYAEAGTGFAKSSCEENA